MVFENVGTSTPLYPSVGLRHSAEAARVNFGQEPFRFDIEDHMVQARRAAWAKIMRTPLRSEFLGGGGGTGEKTTMAAAEGAAGQGDEAGKGAINQLVLSYLSHHGYAKSARAFQAMCERRGGLGTGLGDGSPAALPVPAPQPRADGADVEMALSSPAEAPAALPSSAPGTAPDGGAAGLQHGDIELRTRIVNSVVSGDIDTALAETARLYPAVLARADGLMLFKLRCRKFVELLLQAAELKKGMRREEGDVGGATAGNGHGVANGHGHGHGGGADAMDVDRDDEGDEGVWMDGFGGGGGSGSASTAVPTPPQRRRSPGWIIVAAAPALALAQYEAALSAAIAYGQSLQADYKTDERREVRMIFNRTFGVVAYEDPLAAGGEAAEVAGQEARVALATELNQDILRGCFLCGFCCVWI